MAAINLIQPGTSRADRAPGSELQLKAGPVLREKAEPALSQKTLSFLQERDRELATVWLFFTDKGFRDERGFSQAAAGVTLTERARRRRAKVGLDHAVFVDLPVHQPYIDTAVERGATHRRSSRWLNAASFDIPLDILPEIADLPFVADIKPVARFAIPEYSFTDDRSGRPSESQSPEDLDYGPSQAQIFQINVAAAHALGYSGQGVTITMMDAGFRKTHAAFASTVAENRILAEYDFVMNDSNTAFEAGDPGGQWNHGTMTWSICGGFAPGFLIGPAYGADFILCKTEDISSETPVEEDNWVAALEWADSIGTDVITSSLVYIDWYTYEDFDGQTATITLAANLCEGLGIVLCSSIGNEGPAPGTVVAPADAFGMLAVGAVDQNGNIVSFSSRGPTYDGRTKPEVCAMGTSVYGANAAGDEVYGRGDGTSFSSPLIAGAAALLIEARPNLTPLMIREALKTTANHAGEVDNIYGWGIIELGKALNWPVNIDVDEHAGEVPFVVSFANSSWLPAESLHWDFGDGATSSDQTPIHLYSSPGVFDVTLTINTAMGQFSRTIPGLVTVHADTLWVENVQADPLSSQRVEVFARNFIPLKQIQIPFSWAGELDLSLDSFSTAGLRTAFFIEQSLVSYDEGLKRGSITLRASDLEAGPVLEPGAGAVVSLYFDVPFQLGSGFNPVVIAGYSSYQPGFLSGTYEYSPATISGSVRVGCCLGTVGDIDFDGGDEPSLADVTLLIDHLFINKPSLPCIEEADINQSGGSRPTAADVSIGDVAVLIDYLFITGSTLGLADCP